MGNGDKAVRSRFAHWAVMVSVLAPTLALYLSESSAFITGGDSGELASCICRSSLAHPPGYPLLIMLYRSIFDLLNSLFNHGQSPAFILSAISAVIGSCSSAILSLSIYRFTHSILTSIFTALTFSLSNTVWIYSTQVEVFALNNLAISVLLYCTVSLSDRPSPFWARLFALVSGLAMANQQTAALFIIPIALSLAYSHSRLRSPTLILSQIALFAVGLSPYLWLLIASGRFRSWGDTGSIYGALTHILRMEYGTFRLANTNVNTDIPYFNRILFYFGDLLTQSSHFAAALAVYAMKVEGHQRTIQLLILDLIVYIVTFSSLNNLDLSDRLLVGVQQRFFQQPFMIICFLAGVGYDRLSKTISANIHHLGLAFLALHVALSHPNGDPGMVQQYSKSILDSLPSGSLVLASGDLIVHPLYYLQSCEGVRSDINVIAVPNLATYWYVKQQAKYASGVEFPGEYLHSEWPGFTAAKFLQANSNGREIISCGGGLLAAGESPDTLNSQFRAIPFGICSRVVPASAANGNQTRVLETAYENLIIGTRPERNYPDNSWEKAVVDHRNGKLCSLFNVVYDVAFASHGHDVFTLLKLGATLFQRIKPVVESGNGGLDARTFFVRGADIFGHLSRVQRHPFEEMMLEALRASLRHGHDREVEAIVTQSTNPYLKTLMVTGHPPSERNRST